MLIVGELINNSGKVIHDNLEKRNYISHSLR